MKKPTLVNWRYKNKDILSIDDIPKSAIGFVYLLEYDNGKRYIGKKNLVSIRVLKPLKTGKVRKGASRIFKIIKGKRTPYDRVYKESNWKNYLGSSKQTKNLIPIKRRILAYAITNMQLTYLECKYQFMLGVLESDKYLNDNILGKFYRSE